MREFWRALHNTPEAFRLVWAASRRAALVAMGLTVAAAWLLTFARTPYADLLARLEFPPVEIDALSGIPLRGYEIDAFVGLPMLACLGLILACRRHFRGSTA